MAKYAVLQQAPLPILQSTLESKFDFYGIWQHEDEEEFLAEKGPLIRGLVTVGGIKLTQELVNKLPNLEIVSAFSVGVDNLDIPMLHARGIRVTNTPDVLTDCVADTTLALALAITRRTVSADRYVRDGRWPIEGALPPGSMISNKPVGIVGLGRIGAAIARRLEGFGCAIAYWGRSAKPQFPKYTFYESVVELARHCDILIVACALTKETTKIITHEVLDALGPQGFLVNIARGATVDEPELVKALVEGRIAGAGLDVFEKEPHVPEELLNLDNVVLQPHVGSSSSDTHQAMADLVVANLEAHFAGKPLLTPV